MSLNVLKGWMDGFTTPLHHLAAWQAGLNRETLSGRWAQEGCGVVRVSPKETTEML